VGRPGALSRGREGRATRLLRGLSGVLAGGLVVLAAGLVVAAVVASQRGVPGPDAATIAGHAFAAVVAVLVLWWADRSTGAAAAAASVGVVALTAVVLLVRWLV